MSCLKALIVYDVGTSRLGDMLSCNSPHSFDLGIKESLQLTTKIIWQIKEVKKKKKKNHSYNNEVGEFVNIDAFN